MVSTRGPPKELIMDGESGVIRSEVCNKFLEGRGVRLHTRGQEQHARFIERRGARLRDTTLRIGGQLKEEGRELSIQEHIRRGHILWHRASAHQLIHSVQCCLRQSA